MHRSKVRQNTKKNEIFLGNVALSDMLRWTHFLKCFVCWSAQGAREREKQKKTGNVMCVFVRRESLEMTISCCSTESLFCLARVNPFLCSFTQKKFPFQFHFCTFRCSFSFYLFRSFFSLLLSRQLSFEFPIERNIFLSLFICCSRIHFPSMDLPKKRCKLFNFLYFCNVILLLFVCIMQAIYEIARQLPKIMRFSGFNLPSPPSWIFQPANRLLFSLAEW